MADASQASLHMDWINVMLKDGPLACFCIYFLYILVPRLIAIEAAIDRQTRTLIIQNFSVSSVLGYVKWISAEASIKAQSEQISVELDAAEAARKLRSKT